MPYLTFNDYITLTGLNSVGVNTNFINNQINLWSNQINQFTNQYFSNDYSTQSNTINITQCSQNIINFTAFNNDVNFKVEYRQRGSQIWLLATKDINYTIINPQFTTYINGQQINNPIVGVNLECLMCTCECQEFKITGSRYWSNGLPDELKYILIDLITTSLSNNSNCYTSGILPQKYQLEFIELDSDQTRTTRWKRDTKSLEYRNQKIALGINNPEFTSVLSKYQRASLNINYRFNA